MRIIPASYKILTPLNGAKILKTLEEYGRVCYKSEAKITESSAVPFVKMLIARHHESVLEHFSFSVRFVVDRGISHQLVRHRLSNFSQESTRYCNYHKKGDGHVAFIDLRGFLPSHTAIEVWEAAMDHAEFRYKVLVQEGVSPEIARSVLPQSTKTELVMTANLRQWRKILADRTSLAAHPQMREVMVPLLEELRKKIPVVFDTLPV